MTRFAYVHGDQRVRFAPGAVRELDRDLDALGGRRALLLADPGTDGIDRARTALGARVAAEWGTIEPHVPVEQAARATDAARAVDADALVAVGGGSTTGLAKAIALELGLPILAVPTTYAGSEMAPIYGTSRGTVKTTGSDERVRPRGVVYDPELTFSLPARVTAGSGLNALAHCVEGMYAADAAPVVRAVAAQGVRELVAGLERACEEGSDLEARSRCLVGSYLAGMAIASGVALHHKVCHALGGHSRAAHGDLNVVFLPHAMAFNAPAAPAAAATVAAALDVDDPAAGLFDLAERLGAPTSLAELGVAADQLEDIAQASTRRRFDNPRPVETDDVLRLLQAAHRGERPQTATEAAWAR